MHYYRITERSFVLFIISCLSAFLMYSQTPADAMKRIRANSGKYKIGEASGLTEDEARKASLENLMMQLRTTFSLDYKETEKINGSDYDIKSQSDLKASSVMTVENLSTLIYQDNNGWHAMSYISNSDLAQAEKERLQNIEDLIDLGIEQEKKLNIAGALKYYSWALNLLSSFGDNLNMNLEGKNRNAKGWLNKHIPMILDNIEISLADSKIEYDEFDYDHYGVNLELKYAGQQVSALDLSYFNGEREIKPVHGKNGVATLSFPDLKNFKEIAVKIVHDYPDEAKLYDPELKTIYDAGRRINFEGRDYIRLPIKVNEDNIKSSGPARNNELMTIAKGNTKKLSSVAKAANPETTPISGEARVQIDRPITDDSNLINVMKQIENSLRKRNYNSIKTLFTPDGWSIFSLLTSSGDVKVTKAPSTYVVESSNLFTTGKGIIAVR